MSIALILQLGLKVSVSISEADTIPLISHLKMHAYAVLQVSNSSHRIYSLFIVCRPLKLIPTTRDGDVLLQYPYPLFHKRALLLRQPLKLHPFQPR